MRIQLHRVCTEGMHGRGRDPNALGIRLKAPLVGAFCEISSLGMVGGGGGGGKELVRRHSGAICSWKHES